MRSLVLLGDSMIDNAAYVRPGEPDVLGQVRGALPGCDVAMRAIDGQVVADVAAGLDRAPLSADAAVFMTAGGNDALMEIGRLGNPAPMTFAAAMSELTELCEAFRCRYAALLDRLIASAAVMVGTIYHPRFEEDGRVMQRPAEGALAAFNDVIAAEAGARGFRVLEMRRLMTAAADYANPIEPSAIGGAKIAAAVATWVRGLG